MKQLFTPYIYIVFFSTLSLQLFSQNLYLNISVNDSIQNYILEDVSYKRLHKKKTTLFATIDSLQLKFDRFGYLNHKIDSVSCRDSIYTAYFSLGKSFKKLKVYYNPSMLSSEALSLLSKKVNADYFEIDFSKVSNTMNKLLNYFELKGRPFTEINMSEIQFEKDYLTSTLNINLSKKRNIDKVIFKGYHDFPKSFLKYYLDLNTSHLFNSRKINQLSKKIKSLPFTQETKPAEVLFSKDSTYLYLYLKKKKANRFDGLVGFSSKEGSNKLNFNGYVDLNLNNVLNSGEQININWKNNGEQRQFFNLGLQFPFFLNSPLTPKIELNIYKQDSSFINSKYTLKIGYLFNYQNKINLIFNSENSNNLLESSTPNILDFKSKQFGLSYEFKIISNFNLHPDKFNISTKITTGTRRSDQRKINQTKIEIQSSYLWSLNYKNHIYINNNSSLLFSENYITNELFRIGGINSIRGFNEEGFFASNFSVLNFEYRYNPDPESYIYSITDFGFLKNDLANTSDKIYSLGLGYLFKTAIGNLNISYALGKFEKEAFNFDNSRFHLKIVNFF